MSVAAGMPIGTIVRVRQRYTVHCAECDWMRTTRTRSAAADKVQAHAAARHPAHESTDSGAVPVTEEGTEHGH